MSSEKEKFNLTNWEIVSVNPVDKNWDWKDMFCFWSVGLQSIMSFALIASLYFVYNLNFYEVLFGSLLASLLVCYLSYIIGKPSQKHGIPFPVFLRVSTGYLGAKYISLLRGFVGVFFFGVQTFFISKSIGYLIRITLFNIDSNFLDKYNDHINIDKYYVNYEPIYQLYYSLLNVYLWDRRYIENVRGLLDKIKI